MENKLSECGDQPEPSSSTGFLSQLQNRLSSGLKPTKTRITSLDGSVKTLTSQGTILSPTDSKEAKAYGFVVDTKPDLSVGQVRSWLFISSQDVPNDLNLISSYGIKNILSLLPGFTIDPKIKPCIRNHLVLEVYDESDFGLKSELILSALEFINDCNKRGEKVLVHCNAGVSRAPSVIILYLMKYEGFNYNDAWEIVKTARPIAKPNDGFLHQLKSI